MNFDRDLNSTDKTKQFNINLNEAPEKTPQSQSVTTNGHSIERLSPGSSPEVVTRTFKGGVLNTLIDRIKNAFDHSVDTVLSKSVSKTINPVTAFKITALFLKIILHQSKPDDIIMDAPESRERTINIDKSLLWPDAPQEELNTPQEEMSPYASFGDLLETPDDSSKLKGGSPKTHTSGPPETLASLYQQANHGKLHSSKAEQKLQRQKNGVALFRQDPNDGKYILTIKSTINHNGLLLTHFSHIPLQNQSLLDACREHGVKSLLENLNKNDIKGAPNEIKSNSANLEKSQTDNEKEIRNDLRFHGNIDRRAAEDLLKDLPIGSALLRGSDKTNGVVISFKDSDGKFAHIKNNMDLSLNELLSADQFLEQFGKPLQITDLVMPTKLTTPEGYGRLEENLQKSSDQVQESKPLEKPEEVTEELKMLVSDHPSVHKNISRGDAESILKNQKDGSALLRYSPGQLAFVLSYRISDVKIEHSIINNGASLYSALSNATKDLELKEQLNIGNLVMPDSPKEGKQVEYANINIPNENLDQETYLHKGITRDDAVAILKNAKPGSAILRFSDTRNRLVLSYKNPDNIIKHLEPENKDASLNDLLILTNKLSFGKINLIKPKK